jgi:hypothetical protein
MGLRRGYIIALAVVATVGIASIFIPRAGNSFDPGAKAQAAADALARRHLPEAIAALKRLTVPGNFRLLTTGCQWYRCYLVPERTGQVAPELPGILRSIGAINPQTRLLQARLGLIGSALNRVEAPVYQRAHIAPPKLIGCGAIYNPRVGWWTHCAYPAMIDDNNVDVFLGPYVPCQPRPCRWTNETEVSITPPSGAPGALASVDS